MIVASDYPFMEIFWTMTIFFLWVLWIWTVITVLVDVFGRRDMSGGGKAGWTVLVIFLPFLGVLLYLIAHGTEMAERAAERAGGNVIT
jgi:hypothetical protein